MSNAATEFASPDTVDDAYSMTLFEFQRAWIHGLWLNAREAGLVAGRTPQRVSNAAKRPNSGVKALRIGEDTNTYYHVSWVARKWPDGPGAQAYAQGLTSYLMWAERTLVRA